MFDMHDGKMLYILTGHSLWNRKHFPFLLCNCRRGDGVKNSQHVCSLRSHEEHIRLQERSLHRWDRKLLMDANQNYNKNPHMDWVDEWNTGVSHFGLDANLFPLSHIRFDVFHLRSAITRHLLSTLRTFIFSQIFDLQKDFEKLLHTVWNTYYIVVWESNRPFSSLKGKEILAFINLIPDIVSFIEERFVDNSFLMNLCGGLSLWKNISEFLHVTTVDDNTKYENQIVQYKIELSNFYSHGEMSFI